MDARDLAATRSVPPTSASPDPIAPVPEWLQAHYMAISGQFASYDEHGDGSSKLWTAYLAQADKYDKEISESWKGDTEGILVFTGLFSATVATFIAEAYKDLKPDSGDQTVVLLGQIAQQIGVLANASQTVTPSTLSSPAPFRPSTKAVIVNSLWVSSLVLSLACALSATLMQQWARHYLQASQRRSVPHQRARLRAFLWEGLQRFGMSRAVELIPLLLHITVFLFFAGLVVFFFPINRTVAYVLLSVVAACAVVYITLTILPIVHADSPYRTPLSPALWHIAQIPVLAALEGIHALLSFFACFPSRWYLFVGSNLIPDCKKRLIVGIDNYTSYAANKLSWEMDARALSWTLQKLDEDGDHELENFIDGIPGCLRVEGITSARQIIGRLIDREMGYSPIGLRIGRLLHTCEPNHGLPERERTHRLIVCLKAIWASVEAFRSIDTLWIFGDALLVQAQRKSTDPQVAIAVRCIGALVARNRATNVMRGVSPGTVVIMDHKVGHFLGSLMDADSSDLAYWRLAHGTLHLVNVSSLVAGVLPYVLDGSTLDGAFTLVWETIRLLGRSIAYSDTTLRSREHLLAVWREVQAAHDEISLHAGSRPGVAHRLPLLRLTKLIEFLNPIVTAIEDLGQKVPEYMTEYIYVHGDDRERWSHRL